MTGSIESGESPKEAIIREAEEEVGLKLKSVTLKTTVFLIDKDYFYPTKKFFALEMFFTSYLDDNQEPINLEPSKQDLL